MVIHFFVKICPLVCLVESEGVKLLLKSAMKVDRDDTVLEVKDATGLLHEHGLSRKQFD